MEDMRQEFSEYMNACLIAPDGQESVYKTQMVYSVKDPYAVRMVFYQNDSTSPVTWVLGRELLWTGVQQEAGLGDIRVKPNDRNEVEITLYSPERLEPARVVVNKLNFADFLQTTSTMVPYGKESDLFNKCLDEKLETDFFRK